MHCAPMGRIRILKALSISTPYQTGTLYALRT